MNKYGIHKTRFVRKIDFLSHTVLSLTVFSYIYDVSMRADSEESQHHCLTPKRKGYL